jgi:hypothetical protein
MIATQLHTLGTKISDVRVLNRTPILAGALSGYSSAARLVPASVALPGEQQWPQSNLAAGILLFKGAPANRRCFSFAHWHLTAAAASTSQGRLWGLKKSTCEEARPNTPHGDDPGSYFEVVKVPLITVALTAGANAVPTESRQIERPGGVGLITYVPGTGIVTSDDYTREASGIVYHSAADGKGTLEIDSEGFERYMWEFVPGSGVGVFVESWDL